MADSENGSSITGDVSTTEENGPQFFFGGARTSRLPNGEYMAVVVMLDPQHTVDPYGTLLGESGTAQGADPSTVLNDARTIAEQNLRVRSGEMALNNRGLRIVYDAQNQTS